MQSLPPGFVSRVAAVVLAGALVFVLQDDLAERLASPPDPPVLVVRSARTPVVTSVAEPEPPGEANVAPVRKPEAKTPPPPVSPASKAPAPGPVAAAQSTTENPDSAEDASLDDRADAEADDAPAPEPTVLASAGFRRMTELFEAGNKGEARREAQEILQAFETHSDVTVALVDEGVPTHRARLWTILALHVAGEEEEAREQARLIRASHPDNKDVGETLRSWNILRPRIVEVSSFLNEQQTLVLKGTVRNEDIGAIRKVKVRGEALDDGGNVLAAIDTRVKPRLIASDVAGEFEILFKNLADHEQVKRTRATVIQFEYEVASNR